MTPPHWQEVSIEREGVFLPPRDIDQLPFFGLAEGVVELVLFATK
jgi:hypothetical protein